MKRRIKLTEQDIVRMVKRAVNEVKSEPLEKVGKPNKDGKQTVKHTHKGYNNIDKDGKLLNDKWSDKDPRFNESRTRSIKLSENDLHRVITESVKRMLKEDFYDMDDMDGYEEDYDDNYDDYQDHNFDEYQPDHYCSDCEDEDYNGMTFQTSNDGNHIRHSQGDDFSNWKDLEGDDDDPFFNDEYGNELHTNNFQSF